MSEGNAFFFFFWLNFFCNDYDFAPTGVDGGKFCTSLFAFWSRWSSAEKPVL